MSVAFVPALKGGLGLDCALKGAPCAEPGLQPTDPSAAGAARSVFTVQLNPYATSSIANAAATSLGCARTVPANSAAYTATNRSGSHGYPGTLNGAGPSRPRSRNKPLTA